MSVIQILSVLQRGHTQTLMLRQCNALDETTIPLVFSPCNNRKKFASNEAAISKMNRKALRLQTDTDS